ncbi:hypothetical protein [Rhodanobacter umsongensis]
MKVNHINLEGQKTCFSTIMTIRPLPVAPRKFLPSKAEFDRLGLGHSTRIVWIRGRQYFLDATVDPVTHDVLSYRLRGGPRQRACLRKIVA